MRCSTCHRELPIIDDGAVRCVCGAVSVVAPAVAPAASSPYRALATRATEPGVRCLGCFALSRIGDTNCARCGGALGLEAVPEATGEPCPRCAGAMQRCDAWDECAACRGIFVSHSQLAALIAPHKRAAPEHPSQFPMPTPATGTVSYVACPSCGELMSRRNFAERSGIIVDVCAKHGTWFDDGELDALVRFAQSGGLADAERRARARAQEAERPKRSRDLAARDIAVAYDGADEAFVLDLVMWFGD